MKRLSIFNILFCCVLYASSSFAFDNAYYLPAWLELLNKGNAKEKQIALDNLWLLQDPHNRTDNRVFDPILKTLKDKDPAVRQAAAAFVKTLGERTRGCCLETEIVPVLRDSLKDKNAGVRAEAAKALGYYKDKRSVEALIGSLKDPNVWVKLNVINSLGALGEQVVSIYSDNSKISPIITNKNKKKSSNQVGSRIEFPTDIEPTRTSRLLQYRWGDLGVEKAVGDLIALLGDESKWQNMLDQQEIVRTLGRIRTQDKNVITVLLKKTSVDYLKRDIVKALGRIGALEAADFLTKALRDQDGIIRIRALDALTQLPIEWNIRENNSVVDYHKAQLKDSYEEVRAYSAFVLGKIGGKSAVSGLQEALRDKSDLVISIALESLKFARDPDVLVDYIDLFGNKNKQIADTAITQFQETTKWGIDQIAYVFRLNGSKYVVIKQNEEITGLTILSDSIPEKFRDFKYQRARRFVHPAVAQKLIDVLKKPDGNAKLKVLDVITLFEDDRIEQVLLDLIDDKSPYISGRALVALGQYGSSKSAPRLIQILKGSDQNMKTAAINALSEIRDKKAVEPVRPFLADPDPNIRAAAMRCLDSLGQKDAEEMAITVLTAKPSQAEVLSALATIKKTYDRRAVEPLIAILHEKKGKQLYEVREVAVVLGELGDKRAVDPLMETLSYIDEQGVNFIDNGMKYDIIDALVKLNDKRAVPLLIRMLRSKDPGLKEKSIRALSFFKDPSAVFGLIEVSSEARFTNNAVGALGNIGDPAALDYLEKLLYDYEPKKYSDFIVRAIGEINNEKSVDILLRYLNSDATSRGQGYITISALIKQNNLRAIKPIIQYAEQNDHSDDKWRGSMYAKIGYELKHSGISNIKSMLSEYTHDTDKTLQIGSIRVLGEMGNDLRELKVLFGLLKTRVADTDPRIQEKAAAAIRRIEEIISITESKTTKTKGT